MSTVERIGTLWEIIPFSEGPLIIGGSTVTGVHLTELNSCIEIYQECITPTGSYGLGQNGVKGSTLILRRGQEFKSF